MESTIGKVASMSIRFQAGNEEGLLPVSSQQPVNLEGMSAHNAGRVSVVRFDGIKELNTVVAQSDLTSIV